MIDTDTRARGVTLTMINVDALLPTVREQLNIPEDHSVDFGHGPWAIATDPRGQLWAVCHEGVGFPVDEDRPLELDVYDASPGYIAIAPCARVKLTLGDVEQLPKGRVVDLADLVRSFGSRLESNFWTMHRQLTRGR